MNSQILHQSQSFAQLAKTEHTHPLRAVQSTHFWAENRLEIGLKNGAYPFNRLKRWKSLEKTEHCRSPVVREVWWLGDVFQMVYRRQIPATQIWGVQEMPWDIKTDTDTAIIHFCPNKISDMKKSIQDEIDALKAETAAAYAAIASYNREKEFYRQQADEAAVELEKLRAELLRADRENAKLLQKYDVLKNRSKH